MTKIAPSLDATLRERLAARYAEPARRYHTLAHVDALLRGLASWQRLAREPETIVAAIWFHDAIYDPQRRNDEARSADLARTELADLGWPRAAIYRAGRAAVLRSLIDRDAIYRTPELHAAWEAAARANLAEELRTLG